MNKEGIANELNGQMMKLLEFYIQKDKLLQSIEKEKKELELLEQQIKEQGGIIQTLQFMIQTEGFTKLPTNKEPIQMPSKTSVEELNKVINRELSGEEDA